MTWLRAIHGATSRDKRVRLFYVMDQRFASFKSARGHVQMRRDLQSVLKPACDKDCFALTAVCGKLCFLANLSVFVIWRGSPPRMSELLTYLHLEDGAESAR